MPSRQLPQAVRDGDVDVALSRWADDTDQLFAHTLRRLRSGVILRASDALAGRAEVALGDLAGRSLVMHRREDAPARHDATLAACAEAGVEPEIVTARLPFDPLFTDVAEGRGVQIASESIRGALPAGLRWVPLASGVLEARVDLLWDPARAHPSRDAFLDEATLGAGARVSAQGLQRAQCAGSPAHSPSSRGAAADVCSACSGALKGCIVEQALGGRAPGTKAEFAVLCHLRLIPSSRTSRRSAGSPSRSGTTWRTMRAKRRSSSSAT